MENQCLGIAERLGVEAVAKRVQPRAPWKYLPESLLGQPWPLPFLGLGPESDTLTAPWPDLLIACGRQTMAYSIAIRRLSGGQTFTVQTQAPKLPARFFDLVVPPQHDLLEGPNVLPILGSTHRITPERIAQAASTYGGPLPTGDGPLVSVMVGGRSRHYAFSPADGDRLIRALKELLEQGYRILLTASRRTPPDLASQLSGLAAHERLVACEPSDQDAYFAYLGLSDYLLVTEDSTNMVTEAAATGKPLFIFGLEGGSAKFKRFHAELADRGITRLFDGTLTAYRYERLDETSRVADEIRRRLAERPAALPTPVSTALSAASAEPPSQAVEPALDPPLANR